MMRAHTLTHPPGATGPYRRRAPTPITTAVRGMILTSHYLRYMWPPVDGDRLANVSENRFLAERERQARVGS